MLIFTALLVAYDMYAVMDFTSTGFVSTAEGGTANFMQERTHLRSFMVRSHDKEKSNIQRGGSGRSKVTSLVSHDRTIQQRDGHVSRTDPGQPGGAHILSALDCENPNAAVGVEIFCHAARGSVAPKIASCESSAPHIWMGVWAQATKRMAPASLKRVLEISQVKIAQLYGKDRVFFSPKDDEGLTTVLRELQGNEVADYNLDKQWLKPRELYVDVGSNLGIVSLLVALGQDPTTRIVGIEAAAPTWLFSLLNLNCNLTPERMSRVTMVNSGLSNTDRGSMKMRWRSGSTTSTRDWSPIKEREESRFGVQIDIDVPLHTLSHILREHAFAAREGMTEKSHPEDGVVNVGVMKVDCEGCEYFFIPSLSEEQFLAIRSMVGEIHFGYIPIDRQPSYDDAKATHERLCIHENFASQAMECCTIQSAASEHPELCSNFGTWVREPQHAGLLLA